MPAVTAVFLAVLLWRFFTSWETVAASAAAPVRLIHLFAAYCRSLPGSLMMLAMKRWGWRVLRRMASGDSGYPFNVGPVRQIPRKIGEAFYGYEKVPLEAERTALARRNKNITEINLEGDFSTGEIWVRHYGCERATSGN
jgi:hypothetical protein